MNQSSDSENLSNALRQLPSAHELLSTDALNAKANELGRNVVRETARLCLDRWRAQIQSGSILSTQKTCDSIATEVRDSLDQRQHTTVRRVINATGILLHTGLGRAPLSDEAMEAVLRATGYCNVELDLFSGSRKKRHESVQADLCAFTGPEAAMVVNNNAGVIGLSWQHLHRGEK